MTEIQTPVLYGGSEAYSQKTEQYFAGARASYVSELPDNPESSILEIGCGSGGTGALALAQRKCRVYCGVELFEPAAREAAKKLTRVIVGNIEELEMPWQQATFDALILSEVLEHLVDPWSTLRKLRPLLKPGARVFASSPNVSQWRVIWMLLQGEWNLADCGPMDKTHLRWFTPKSYQELFESCGYRVDSVRPVTPLSRKAALVSALTFGTLHHLSVRQVDLRAHRAPVGSGLPEN